MGEQLLQLVMPGIEFGFNKQFMEHYHIHTQ